MAPASFTGLDLQVVQIDGQNGDAAGQAPFLEARQGHLRPLPVQPQVGRGEIEPVGPGAAAVAMAIRGMIVSERKLPSVSLTAWTSTGPECQAAMRGARGCLSPGSVSAMCSQTRWASSAKLPTPSKEWSFLASMDSHRRKNSSRASLPHAVVEIRSSSWRNVGYLLSGQDLSLPLCRQTA